MRTIKLIIILLFALILTPINTIGMSGAPVANCTVPKQSKKTKQYSWSCVYNKLSKSNAKFFYKKSVLMRGQSLLKSGMYQDKVSFNYNPKLQKLSYSGYVAGFGNDSGAPIEFSNINPTQPSLSIKHYVPSRTLLEDTCDYSDLSYEESKNFSQPKYGRNISGSKIIDLDISNLKQMVKYTQINDWSVQVKNKNTDQIVSKCNNDFQQFVDQNLNKTQTLSFDIVNINAYGLANGQFYFLTPSESNIPLIGKFNRIKFLDTASSTINNDVTKAFNDKVSEIYIPNMSNSGLKFKLTAEFVLQSKSEDPGNDYTIDGLNYGKYEYKMSKFISLDKI